MLIQANTLDPNSYYILDSLAWVYYKKKDYKKAAELMEEVIDTLSRCRDLSDPAFDMYYIMQDAVNKEVIYPMEG